MRYITESLIVEKRRESSLFKFSRLLFMLLCLSLTTVKAQIEVSVPFNSGFIGTIGGNTQQANNIQNFSTLKIAKVSFVQTTNSGRFELTQGNDIAGVLRIQMQGGQKVDVAGSLVWRVNSGSTNQVFGFIANSNVSFNLSTYGGTSYLIQGGNTTGRSNFGLKLNNATYTIPANGTAVSGNAASGNTALSDLNAYLDALPRVISPNPQNFTLNASNQNPGDFSLSGFGSNTVLCAVGLVNPPAGVSFSFSTTTGLTLSTGYSSWTGLTRVSFTGSQANINAALASMSVTTGNAAGDIKISVSASINDAGVFFNPINGHYYKPVAGAITYSNAKSGAAAQTYKGQTGYLVTITSQVEQDFVNSNTTQNNIWIALSDANSEGTWYIDDGPENGRIIWRTSVSGITNSTTSSYASSGNTQGGFYNNWCSGEPNNSFGSTGEDHAVTKWNNGTCWNDLHSSNTAQVGGYLIEFGTWTDPDDNAFLDFYTASTTYTANCPSNQSPAAPTVVSQGTRTGTGSVQLVVSSPAGTTVDWYAAASGGTVLTGGSGVTTFTTPQITATTTYYAQTRNSTSGCLSATRTLLTATILPPTAPSITSFTPTVAGKGETVVINGSGFNGVTVVRFGNVDAESFTINSDNQITAVVGAAASGSVFVSNSGGSDQKTGFVFKIVEYKFENNTLDATTADRDGTVTGTVSYGAGVEGTSICFNRSTSNFVTLPNNLIRSLTSFTISLQNYR